MANTGLGRWHNVPTRGQRGFPPHRDHYDITGEVPPRHLQCELPDCQDIANPAPWFRGTFAVKLCEYHTRLCDRTGAPQQCDIPWPEFYRIRDAAKKQISKMKDTLIVQRAFDAVYRLPGKCYSKAFDMEREGKEVHPYLRYGMSLNSRVDPWRFIAHHVAFGVLIDRGIWQPQPGFPRHADKAWLRCVHRSLTRGQKGDRTEIGPYQASLLRSMIAPDLQIITGRTDYCLREADLIGKDVLPARMARGWFQDSLT